MTAKLPYEDGVGVQKVGEPDIYRKSPVSIKPVSEEIMKTSEECRDFLAAMLEEDPEKRWSIQQAYTHSWVLIFDM